MKAQGLILLSALLIAAVMMHGQEAAPPSVDLFPEQEEERLAKPPIAGRRGDRSPDAREQNPW